MNRLAEALKNTPFLVLDGALATELERAGMDLADPLWSARALMEAPEAILRVHRSYLEAGADIITSAGYQATIPGFMAKGCSRKEAERLLRLAVRLVKRARDEYEAETGRRALAAASARWPRPPPGLTGRTSRTAPNTAGTMTSPGGNSSISTGSGR